MKNENITLRDLMPLLPNGFCIKTEGSDRVSEIIQDSSPEKYLNMDAEVCFITLADGRFGKLVCVVVAEVG